MIKIFFREIEKSEELERLKDEIQYQMKKKINLKVSTKAADYFSTFDKILAGEKSSHSYSEGEKSSIIDEVIQYLQKKEAKRRAEKRSPAEKKRSRSRSRSPKSP